MLGRTVRAYALYILVCAVLLTPVLWMVWSSLRANVDITAFPPRWSSPLTLQNYEDLFVQFPFGRYTLNSLVVAVGSSLAGLAIGVPAAYCVARHGQRALGLSLLAARMAPGMLFAVPLFVLSGAIGGRANVAANLLVLVLSHLLITVPVSVWIMVPFFRSLPAEIFDATMVDGASELERFRLVALPLVRPGLGVALVLDFIFSWNYFVFGLTLARGENTMLPVISFSFIGEGSANWGGLMAAGTVIAIPALVLAFLAQRLLVRGLTSGAVRG
ncbi:MAG: carbohydrate ABC transporter permease [Chloroflexi bacterium]|nr:carbohydrate ABC transporter permease [Chloroflexota bacterium]